MRVSARIGAFLRTEGAVARLLTGWATGAGVIMQSDYGSYEDDAPLPPPSVVVIPEQYGRIHRLIERAVPVRLEIAVDAQFYPKAQGINVIAELPGNTPGGEFVMLGAHLDSWHGATGATDNGAGSAVVMEVMRILASLDRPLARGVRAALWSGEEQCLCGSRAYVKQHFADPVTMQLKPEHARLSAYFNLDNGAGRIRGVYLQGNDMAQPDLRDLVRAARRARCDALHAGEHVRHRSSVVQRGRVAGVPVHAGSARLRPQHAPLERR